MEYRSLGRTGLTVSAVSLGTEYLINQPRDHVVTVIREAIARGVNYFDLFFAQAEFRDNMGAAFQGRRDRVLLAAHLGAIHVNGQGDRTRDPAVAERFLLDFLSRYRTDYVDVLFLHNIDLQDDYDRVMGPGGLLDLAQRYRAEGKARAIGFSGHSIATALQAAESGAVDVIMFPVNLTGHAIPERKTLLQACAERGVGLVAMKPYAGGKLLRAGQTLEVETWQRGSYQEMGGAPVQVERRSTQPITPVQCLAYILTLPDISTIVPGCKDLAELEAAQAVWTATSEERDFAPALAAFPEYLTGECVYGNHCLPCPASIDVGQTIRLLETAQGRPTPGLLAAYAALPAPASDCTQCGSCAERCPFGVDAVAKIEEAAALFGGVA